MKTPIAKRPWYDPDETIRLRWLDDRDLSPLPAPNWRESRSTIDLPWRVIHASLHLYHLRHPARRDLGTARAVCQDRRHVSFMYSYPNYIPLTADGVRRVVAAVEPFAFDRIFGFMFDLVIKQDAKAAVFRSAARYLRAIGAEEAGGQGA